MSQNFDAMTAHGKSLAGLTPELETYLKDIAPIVIPHLPKVTDAFYIRLITQPSTCAFLEKHIDQLDYLKETHLNWLTSLFTLDIDADFAQSMVKVGDAHVAIHLPLEFMAGAMFLMNKELIRVVVEEMGDTKQHCTQALQAINAVLGFTLIVMQQSYNLWD